MAPPGEDELALQEMSIDAAERPEGQDRVNVSNIVFTGPKR